MPYKNNGFTLIELLIALAISALLVMISSPTLLSLFNRLQHQSESLSLFEMLQFARSQAIVRQQNIAVCPSKDLMHCSLDWSQGYIAYVVGSKKIPSEESVILRVHQNFHAIPIESPSLKSIEYTPEGRCLSRGTLYFRGKDQTQKIVLYDSGRARMEVYDNQQTS